MTEDKRQKILLLHAQGYSNREISVMLDIPWTFSVQWAIHRRKMLDKAAALRRVAGKPMRKCKKCGQTGHYRKTCGQV